MRFVFGAVKFWLTLVAIVLLTLARIIHQST